MSEKGILMNGEMVVATLEDRKTETRRLRVQDITTDEMNQQLEGFGWDYAESSDGTGDMFMYWDHTSGDPPKWADWITSCECIEDVFASFWNSIYPGSWERNDWVWVFTFKRIEK